VITTAEVIDRHRDKVKRLVDEENAILNKLPPHVYTDTLKPPDSGPVTIGGSDSNTPLLYPLGSYHPYNVKDTAGDALDDCEHLVELGVVSHALFKDEVPTPFAAEGVLAGCESFKYLLVVRLWSAADPSVSGYQTFKAGHVEGDALLFNLQTGKSFGGVHFKAANSEQVNVGNGFTDQALEDDLRRNTARAISDGIRKHVPGATVTL
jgi:hypothetical protein